MVKQLFASDKAPFILSLTLSILSWLLTTTMGNLTDVIVLGVDVHRSGAPTVFTVTNYSIKKPLADAVIGFSCIKNDCLDAKSISARDIPPYSIQGNKICSSTARNVVALLSLPPTAAIKYEMNVLGEEIPRFTFSGVMSEDQEECPGSLSKLKVDNVWLVEGFSITLLLLQYYYHILVFFILLTLVFLIWTLLRPSDKRSSEACYDT